MKNEKGKMQNSKCKMQNEKKVLTLYERNIYKMKKEIDSNSDRNKVNDRI